MTFFRRDSLLDWVMPLFQIVSFEHILVGILLTSKNAKMRSPGS
jgi:hypothetical protein